MHKLNTEKLHKELEENVKDEVHKLLTLRIPNVIHNIAKKELDKTEKRLKEIGDSYTIDMWHDDKNITYQLYHERISEMVYKELYFNLLSYYEDGELPKK